MAPCLLLQPSTADSCALVGLKSGFRGSREGGGYGREKLIRQNYGLLKKEELF